MLTMLTIEAYPRVLQEGDTVRLTCRVPRDEHNRGLTMGFDNYTTSFVQLEGEAAAITHQKYFTHVPCNAGRAFCLVTTNIKRQARVHQEVLVSCGQ